MRQEISSLESAITSIDAFLNQTTGRRCKEIKSLLMNLSRAAFDHYRNAAPPENKRAFVDFCSKLGVTHPLKENRFDILLFRIQFEAGELPLDDIDQKMLNILGRLDRFFRKSFLRMQLIEIFTLPAAFNNLVAHRTLNSKELEVLKDQHPGFCPEALQLLVLHEKAKLNKKGIDWDCEALTDLNGLEIALNELLARPLAEGQSQRKQIIVPIWFHYITLDVEVFRAENRNKLRISFFDASQDWKSQPYINMLKKLPMVTNFHNMVEETQIDFISCPMHAFEIAKSLRKTANLYQQLEAISNESNEFKLTDLHPQWCKNVQSVTKIQSKQGNDAPFNKHGENLLQYLARHHGFFSDPEPNKVRNFSIYDKFSKCANRILPLLENMSDDDLHQILSGEKSLESLSDVNGDESAQKVSKTF